MLPNHPRWTVAHAPALLRGDIKDARLHVDHTARVLAARAAERLTPLAPDAVTRVVTVDGRLTAVVRSEVAR